jgi:hypothetical protein
MPVHERARRVVEAYLQAVDGEAPGLVEGLYVVGSVALGEFRPHTSDVDFLAVTSRPVDAAAAAALARAHSRLRRRFPRPCFDGRYVTWDELARDARQAGRHAYSEGGRFHAPGRSDADPVAWHTLARHGVRCRGPETGELVVCTDAAALAAWTLENLDTYWTALVRRARRFPDPWSWTALTSYGAVWIVLGVCRLHDTLATGEIVSKEEAGRYGLRTFPARWQLVLDEALRIRRADRARPAAASAVREAIGDLRARGAGGTLYPSPIARRSAALAFAEAVIDDAKLRFAPR